MDHAGLACGAMGVVEIVTTQNDREYRVRVAQVRSVQKAMQGQSVSRGRLRGPSSHAVEVSRAGIKG